MNTGIVLLNAASEATGGSAEALGIPGVILLGLGMVFVGLVCIIIICKLMGLIFRAFAPAKSEAPAQTQTASAPAKVTENRGEIIAAVSAAVAEELGTDVSALRIISFRKL